MTQEVFCFLASAYRKAYTLDVVNVISFPENSTYRLRYREKYIVNKEKNLDNLKKLTEDQDSEKNNCLFLFFDKEQIKDQKIENNDLEKAFIPIRWCKVAKIIETKAFTQIEIILGRYFNLIDSQEIIDEINSVSRDETWNGRIDLDYNSFKYFVFPIYLSKKRIKSMQDSSDWIKWKDICNTLFKYETFKCTAFQIFKQIVEIPDEKTVDIQDVMDKLKGYKLNPGKFYALEIVQYINPEFYPFIEKGVLSLHMPKEHIRQVENKIEIVPGGPYIFYSPKFYTRKTFRGCLGLLGIIIKDFEQNQNNTSGQVLYPQITVPLKINPTRKELLIPALGIIVGFAITGCGIIFELDIGVECLFYLIGILSVAFGAFFLATLEGRN